MEGDVFSSVETFANQNDTFNQTGLNRTEQEVMDPFFFYESAQFTVLWILFVAIVAGNSSVIAALLRTNARKSRMNFFIMQLAITDLFVGVIYVFPDIIQKITISWLAGDIMCKIVKYLQAVVMYASTYVLVALSIDRCDAITNPMNFSGSWKRARVLVAVAWFFSVVFSVPLLFLFEEKEVMGHMQCWIELQSPSRWRVYMTIISTLIFVIPAIVIAACYTVIVLTIWTKSKAAFSAAPMSSTRRTKNVNNGKGYHGDEGYVEADLDTRRASSRGLIPRAKIKTVKMTFVIVFVFILCWSPYFIFDLLQVYDYLPRTQTTVAVATLVQSLAPLNSAANPIICCLFSSHIYKGLRRVPPYSWFICSRRTRGRAGTRSESTAHSELHSSSHTKRCHSIHSGPTVLNSRHTDSVTRLTRNGHSTHLLPESPRD